MQTYTLSARVAPPWSLLFELNEPVLLQIILPDCDVSAITWNTVDKRSNCECAAWRLHVRSYSRCARQLPAHNRCHGDIAAEDVFTSHLTLVHVRSIAPAVSRWFALQEGELTGMDDLFMCLIFLSQLCPSAFGKVCVPQLVQMWDTTATVSAALVSVGPRWVDLVISSGVNRWSTTGLNSRAILESD